MSHVIDFRISVPHRLDESDDRITPPGEMARYEELYSIEALQNMPLTALVEEMDRSGVDLGVLHAEYEWGSPQEWNATVARALRRHPDRFIGIGTVDPADGARAAYEARRCFEDYGFRGINLQACVSRIPATDRRSYLIYSTVLHYDGVVTVHTGVNFFRTSPISLGRPVDVCEIACDLPELRIVCCHGGWPWTAEMAAVVWKHPNVYVEFGAIAPKYVARQGTGWEPLWNLAHNQLAERTMFGTDWPLLRYDRALAELADAGVTPESQPRFFADNARAVLGLEDASTA
jgi:predicted TIM-barrel fold metal-dependent hydrolase